MLCFTSRWNHAHLTRNETTSKEETGTRKTTTAFNCSLQDTGFIPFDGASADNFIDVVDNNHEVFTPDIINSTEAPVNNLE